MVQDELAQVIMFEQTLIIDRDGIISLSVKLIEGEKTTLCQNQSLRSAGGRELARVSSLYSIAITAFSLSERELGDLALISAKREQSM